jgi:hypothetical protein
MSEEKWATSNDEYGYLAEGEPTDAQLRLQDALDSITQDYVQQLYDIHAMVGDLPQIELEHDIHILFHLREKAEELMGLGDIY